MIEKLPTVNAVLNGLSAFLLCGGYHAIRTGRARRHIRFMIAALAASALFLVSYLVYHYVVGSKGYAKEGWTRPVYFTILISHTVLAALLALLVPWTVTLAVKRRFDRHRRLARWTLPIWLYVNVTGVVIYLMLYVF